MEDKKPDLGEKFENFKDGAKDAFENIKEGAKDAVESAKETAQKINVDDIKAEVKEAVQDVKEETKEVVEEAKAAVHGEKLETANTVGGAGYRADSGNNGLAIASLVLGILSIILSFLGYATIAGLVLGIVGVVLGAKARKEAQTGLATAGFVCSIIGVILCAIGLVCVLACAGAACALRGCN